MPGLHLHTQFYALFHHFNGIDTETTLHEMAEILSCTRRNARMVLNKMATQGWIEWRPAPGRSKRSQLSFYQTDSHIQMKRVRDFFKSGKLPIAREEQHQDPNKLATLIEKQMGFSNQNGKLTLRLPYYRAFSCLNPANPLRTTEQELVFLLFNGLTKLNKHTNKVEGDLAHHWTRMSPTHWRFYLRPCVKFHDGHLLEAQDVIASLLPTRKNAYFSHIEDIQSPSVHVVDFFLKHEDHSFPYVLASTQALIHLKHSKQKEEGPIGTGPYFIVIKNPHYLQLNAFDAYFGFRALTDTLEIWTMDHNARGNLPLSLPVSSSKLDPFDPSRLETGQGALFNTPLSQYPPTSSLDEGAYYLLLNRNTGIAKNPSWAEYFAFKLGAKSLLSSLSHYDTASYRLAQAYGLQLGSASSHSIPSGNPFPPKRNIKLRLTHQTNHPLFPLLAKAIKEQLILDGIEVEILVIPYEKMMNSKEPSDCDLWIGKIPFTRNKADFLISWMMNFKLFQTATPKNEFNAIKDTMRFQRENSEQSDPKTCDHKIEQSLMQSRQVIPLFHVWIGPEKLKALEGGGDLYWQ